MSFEGPNLYDPGEMDYLVTLLSPVETRDAAGGVIITFNNAGTIWADFTPGIGREIQQASQKLGLAVATIRIRYRTITDRWRLLVGSTIYDVIAPPVLVGRNVYWDLICQALDPTNLSINGVGIQAFTVTLNQGDTSKTITYPTAFAAVPSAVYALVVAPGGGFVISCVKRAGDTASSCIIDFGGDIPASGYSLSIIAVL